MPVAPSFNDLLAQGMAEAQLRRGDLTFYDGDVTTAQLHAGAAMADAVIRYAAQAFRDTFLDGATGTALRTLVNDHLNIQAIEASQAEVVLTFTRTGGGAAGTILAGTEVATNFDANGNQVVFTTDSDLVFGLGVNGPLTVSATAQNAGPDGNVSAGTIQRILTSLWDPAFTVSNLLVAAGGNLAEDDDQLRERARAFYATLRRGTLATLEFGAKTVSTVRVATAIEDTSTGQVTVRVTDADGGSTAQMVEDVLLALEDYRAAGITVTVVGGTALLVSLDVVLQVRTGFNVAAVAGTIEDALTNRLNKQKVGEVLYLDSLVAAAIAPYPDDIFGVEFDVIMVGGVDVTVAAEAAGSITPGDGQIMRADTVAVA